MATPRPAERPFPPGDYPLVVGGSGPGALQLTYSLTRLGVPHATISADDVPGGMFRRWPFFQRLLSWTKPFAPEPRGTTAYERFDWNSLLAEEPENRALQAAFMDGTSYFPSRPEMERNLAAFAQRTGIAIRYGTRWQATRREEGPEGQRFVLETTDGEYRAPVVVFAVGIAEPWSPSTPGIEHAHHYAETRPAESYADRRVVIIGKQNSGFELASGLLQWARRIVIVSPSPTKLSVDTHSLVGVRARYVQPYEDHVLGGGVTILDASTDAIEPADGRDELIVRLRQTSSGASLAITADDVIAATGFVVPLLDLPDLGVATFGHSRLPAQTPWWESATVPGIHFAGTISQGAQGLRKHGMPSNSGAVQGARYNARILAREIARRHFGRPAVGRTVAAGDVVDLLVEELARGPELWHQRAYLARVVSIDERAGVRDEDFVPLAAFLDTPGPDAIAVTLESDETGAIYPVLYVRRAGRTTEHDLEPDPLLDFGAPRYRAEVGRIAADLAPALATVR
jgi:thioredoxin reductase